MVAANASRRNGSVAAEQAVHHLHLFDSRDGPQNAAGAIENRVSQGHSAPPLIRTAQSYVRALDIQHRVARHKRCSMAIGTEAQVYQVEYRWRAHNLP